MSSLADLEREVSKDVKGYLARLVAVVWKSFQDNQPLPSPVFSLGTLLGWYVTDVSDNLVRYIEKQWDTSFPNSEARALHMAAVRDRLSRDIEPEIPEGAFDAVRLSQTLAATQGWTPEQQARDIAERLSWEPDKGYWKTQLEDIENEIDAILDPLGPPGTPARTLVHKNDPRIKELQRLRSEAVHNINADKGIWEVRAKRIARTEFTAMQAAGSLAALVAEGVTHKKWLATKDPRTRETHRLADGEVVDILGAFDVGGFMMQMPGDPTAPPEETVNCRCTIVGATEEDYHKSLLASADEKHENVIVAGIPAPDDPIHAASSEDKAHITMLFFGPAEGADLDAIKAALARVAAAAPGAVVMPVTDRDTLGKDNADVLHVDPGPLSDVREALLADPAVRAAHDAVEQYPQWTPHVTLGYPETPALADPADKITIDRLALWTGDYEGPEYILGADADDLDALLASGLGWKDQLRIPQGNGKRSGRWTYTPWAWLDNLEVSIGLQPEVAQAQSRLDGIERNGFDVRDPALRDAVIQAAKDLEGVPGAEETHQALKDWADTDWSLFAESTDIGSNDDVPISKGKKGLWQWHEPLPPDKAVNPKYEDQSSASLVARLDEIANHHTAPSPKMRRDRAEIMEELNNRKAGGSPDNPPTPHPDPKTLPDLPDTPRPHLDPVKQVHEKMLSGLVPVGDALRDKDLTDDQRKALNLLNENPDGLTASTLSERLHGGEGTPAMLDAVMLPLVDKKYTAKRTAGPSTSYFARPATGPSTADIVNAYAWGGLGIQNGLEVNGNLRSNGGYDQMDKQHKDFVDALDAAIAAEDSKGSMRVYRTIDDPAVAERVARLKPGSTFTDPAYMSTTTDESILDDFLIEDNGSRVDLVIDVRSGDQRLDVDKYTPDDQFKQSEVLLPRNTRLKITHVAKGTDGYVVTAVIDNETATVPTSKPDFPDYTPDEITSILDTHDSDHRWRPTLAEPFFRYDMMSRGTGSGTAPLSDEDYAFAKAVTDAIERPDRSPAETMAHIADLAREAGANHVAEAFELASWAADNEDMKALEQAFESALWASRVTPLGDSKRASQEIASLGRHTLLRVQEGASQRGERRAIERLQNLVSEVGDKRAPNVVRGELHDIVREWLVSLPKRKAAFPTPIEKLLNNAFTATEHDAVPAAVVRRMSILSDDPAWQDSMNDIARMLLPDVASDMKQRHGELPPEETTPERVIEHIGRHYGIRTLGSNCVLASNAYELRRRGIDVEPKQAKKGRASSMAQEHWFLNPEFHTVKGLKGLQKRNRSRVVYKHVSDHYPPGSRGTIRCGWKGRSFGHIWNWEVHEDGEVVFYDAQTGAIVPPDSGYWFDMDWDNVQTVRLDHLVLLEDIEVIVEPNPPKPDADEARLQAEYRRLTEMMEQIRSTTPMDWDAYTKVQDERGKIRQQLRHIADSYMIADPNVNTIDKLPKSQKLKGRV